MMQESLCLIFIVQENYIKMKILKDKKGIFQTAMTEIEGKQ